MRRWLFALSLCLVPSWAVAQSVPTLQPFQATGLSMPYTTGTVTVGGLQQVINAGSVTLTDNQNNCSAPQFPACNFVYWAGSGVTLSTTTSPQVAFAPGTAIVGFVPTTGGVVGSAVYFSQAGNMSDNLIPAGVIVGSTGFRLPLCNLLLKTNCQVATTSLSGY